MWNRWIALLAVLLLPLPALADAEAAWKAYCARNYDRALRELRPLAQAGDAKAQYYLASIHLDGAAVPRSAAIAVDLLQRSATAGHEPAQFTLGLLLYNGSAAGEDRLEPDRPRALPWLVKAAEAGVPLAHELVGTEYAEGRYLPRDLNRARYHLGAAANAGLVNAQAALGALLGAEYGVQNAMEAYKWLLLAARAKHPGAAENLAAMESRLNADERRAATAAAERFTPMAPPAGACPAF
ncbi:MAG: sel1 repeat family protein [Rhodospirillales bacterium]|nr:sel1 repeat family protein [Rhodospirillales bacterium]